MEGMIEEKHLLYWDQLIKNDVGSKRFHVPNLIFYVVGVLALVINVATDTYNNRAYLVAYLAVFFVSAGLYSVFYQLNEAVIDKDNLTFHRNAKQWSLFRSLSQIIFVLTPLFRICANWKDQKERHETVRMQQKLRRDITEQEINAAVVNKKRSIVKACFDCIDAFSKALPHCILQIYIAVDLSLPLRFCTWTDYTRLITIVWSIIVASRATASYATSLTEYLKAMEFQDYVTYAIPINLDLPKRHLWWTTFLTNLVVIGTRIFVLAHMLTFNGGYIPSIVGFILYSVTIRLNFFRTRYENPPSGIVTLCSDIVDRVINVFCIHMMKPGLGTNLIHQLMFVLTYCGMKGWQLVMFVFPVQPFQKDQETGNSNITLITPSFTIFQVKDIFANESICIILLCVAFAVSNLNSLYVRYDHKFPLQTSIKAWEGFLNVKWAETEASLERALSTLLLGVWDTKKLDYRNYVLPKGISGLKKAIRTYVEQNSNVLTIASLNAIMLEKRLSCFVTIL